MKLNTVTLQYREDYYEFLDYDDYVLFYYQFSGNGQYAMNWQVGIMTGGFMRFDKKTFNFMQNSDIQPLESNQLED